MHDIETTDFDRLTSSGRSSVRKCGGSPNSSVAESLTSTESMRHVVTALQGNSTTNKE
jgi:hypothetical protein